ncbi:hypothetical protein, partial [Aquiflexum sp.]|uniref:hypothetical protein n=1 Tax=Aquiflexum sp. TaxID=1872584 RepID=UPI003594097C
LGSRHSESPTLLKCSELVMTSGHRPLSTIAIGIEVTRQSHLQDLNAIHSSKPLISKSVNGSLPAHFGREQ